MKQSSGHLRVLTIMGSVLTLASLIIGFPLFIYSAVTGEDLLTAVDGRKLAMAMGVMFACGLVILIYVGIRKFKQGLRGELESKKL